VIDNCIYAFGTERLCLKVKEYQFDSELGKFPDGDYQAWLKLSNMITLDTLDRCGIAPRVIMAGGASRKDQPVEHAPVAPKFVEMSSSRRLPGMTAADISEFNMDGSIRLQHVLAHLSDSWRELLAELQIAFLLFLLLASLEALDFWKNCVALLCSCGKMLADKPELMSEFVLTLRRQLEHVPADFFRDEIAKSNFLGPSLSCLLQLVDDHFTLQPRDERSGGLRGAQAKLFKRAKRLKELMQKRFDLIDLDDFVLEDEVPTIVESLEIQDKGQENEEERKESSPAVAEGRYVARMPWMLPSDNSEN